MASADNASGHHLLKHTAPSIDRVIECFDGAPLKEIAKVVAKMGQRDLQVGALILWPCQASGGLAATCSALNGVHACHAAQKCSF
jgi:hypothetical protein